jgi:hypothetical protein
LIESCEEWDQLFLDCILLSLTSMISDHCPLLLGLHEFTQGKRRFHFESFWPHLEGFLEEVARSWDQSVEASCPLQVLANKLKRLSCHLQSWSQCKVGNIKQQLQFPKEIIHRLEIAQDSRDVGVFYIGKNMVVKIVHSSFKMVL